MPILHWVLAVSGVVSPMSGAPRVDAPITAVTVYADRARVTRSAHVAGTGRRRVELPLLPERVNPATIRVEADGAEVARVDVARATEEEFPVDEARALLAQLEALDDRLARNRAEREAWAAQRDAARNLKPVVPQPEGQKPRPKLNPSGWAAVGQFATATIEKAEAQLRALDEAQRKLARERQALVEKARLLGGVGRRGGWRVSPTLTGGDAKIRLVYEIDGASWTPTYDIQLRPETGQVDVQFAGEVAQSTGEDWADARLTLSTAMPASATRLPRLRAWKIGERERFIPAAPRPSDPVRPPPPSVPPPREARLEDAEVRRALMARASLSVSTTTTRATRDEGESSNGDRDGDGIPDSVDRCPDEPETYNGLEDDDGCPDRGRVLLEEKEAPKPAAPPPPAPPATMEPAPAQPVMATEEAERAPRRWGAKADAYKPPEPTEQVGLAPPPGWRGPTQGTLAGGWDLTYVALAPESIASGKGARRVALFSRRWPVAAERKLFPALADEAFLVAEIKNPQKEALPGGRAQLYVGADPAGTASLSTVAPGETFTLPLGLDRAVKPVRNVKVNTVEKGVINKDEITEYLVTTEVANPYGAPLALRVYDQIPRPGDRNVEVKLVRSDPPAQLDEPKGEVSWRATIPPRQKSTFTFVYTLKRPKGARLHQ